MSTHNVGRDYGPLQPGMVFTIEPAFQVREEQINIRCEDLLVISESGTEIISDFAPMTTDQIEKQMAGGRVASKLPLRYKWEKTSHHRGDDVF